MNEKPKRKGKPVDWRGAMAQVWPLVLKMWLWSSLTVTGFMLGAAWSVWMLLPEMRVYLSDQLTINEIAQLTLTSTPEQGTQSLIAGVLLAMAIAACITSLNFILRHFIHLIEEAIS